MIYNLLSEQLINLQTLLLKIDMNNYSTKTSMLGNGSIGQHTRHVIEMIQCLVNGYEAGTVNYEDRKRDVRIETEALFAALLLEKCIAESDKPNKILQVWQPGAGAGIGTSYERELLYNMEHAIHHMALIKVALREMQLNITGEAFGVAPATLRYQNAAACAQ
ncbi:MAG: DinB family protein [Rhizobacter sp.]|nr:DinB family protein [Ferruginibacter sp.]